MSWDQWGLTGSPFNADGEAQAFYPAVGHVEAIARLEFLIKDRRRLGVCLGPSGAGKSMLLRQLRQRLERRGFRFLCIDAAEKTGETFLEELATAFSRVAPVAKEPRNVSLWQRVEDGIVLSRQFQQPTVLLLDDALHLDPLSLSTWERIVAVDGHQDNQFTVIATGCSQDFDRLDPTTRFRCDMKIKIPEWTLQECSGLLESRWQAAGFAGSPLSDEQLAEIHAEAAGRPGKVVSLVEEAMLAAARESLDDEFTQGGEVVLELAAIDAGE